jgi:hypothetical protein
MYLRYIGSEGIGAYRQTSFDSCDFTVRELQLWHESKTACHDLYSTFTGMLTKRHENVVAAKFV